MFQPRRVARLSDVFLPFHDGRHSAITSAAAAGVSPPAEARMFGVP
jgi:predicted N-formylglutamate amidohydrolase